VSVKGGRVKKSALPLIIIFLFVVLVGVSTLRHHYFSHIYTPPSKIPQMYKSYTVQVDKPTTVTVAVFVDKNGKPIRDSLVKSSGDPLVDQDALDQALRFKYEPARMGKRLVEGWASVPVKYYPRPDTTEAARTN
jgi:TonB family protein